MAGGSLADRVTGTEGHSEAPSLTHSEAYSAADALDAALSSREALDARCVSLTLSFVRSMAEAEEAFATAVSGASGSLVRSLLEMKADFDTTAEGDTKLPGSAPHSSLRRSALIAASKCAATLASELHAHAHAQQVAAERLASQASENKAYLEQRAADSSASPAKPSPMREVSGKREAGARAALARDEQTAVEALQRAHTAEAIAAASSAANASGPRLVEAADPWLRTLDVEAAGRALHDVARSGTGPNIRIYEVKLILCSSDCNIE